MVTIVHGTTVGRELGVFVAAVLVLDALFVHAPSLRTRRKTVATLGDVPTGRLEKIRRVEVTRARPLEAVRRDISPY